MRGCKKIVQIFGRNFFFGVFNIYAINQVSSMSHDRARPKICWEVFNAKNSRI